MERSAPPIRILLYSGEPMLAEGLHDILRSAGGFEWLPPCFSLASLVETAASHLPDLLVLELTSEVTYAALRDLRRRAGSAAILLWVSSISTELAFQAMSLGVRGILRRTLGVELQVKCLRKVAEGELWFEKSLTDGFLGARGVSLTHRESQLVSLLAQGMRNREIADTLMITEGSVKVYLSRLYQKLGVKDRFELALYGIKNFGSSPGEGSRAGLRPSFGAFAGIRSLLMDKPARREDAPAPNALPVAST